MLSDSDTKSHMEPSRAKILNILEFFQGSLNFFQENNYSGAEVVIVHIQVLNILTINNFQIS